MEEIFSKYKDRVNTAFILVSVLAVILFINNPVLYTIVLWVITMVAIYEAKYMVNMEDMTFVNVSVTLIYFLSFWVNDVYLLVILAYIVALSCKTYFYHFEKSNIDMFLYPVLGISFILSILHNFPTIITVFLILTVALTDIGAFVVGKQMGVNKLSEISPNKTIEGAMGGVAVGTIGAGLFAMMTGGEFIMFIIAFFVSAASIFGDLHESALKRKADVKDSGNILPGHGGALDRLDGYIFSAPVLFILLTILI